MTIWLVYDILSSFHENTVVRLIVLRKVENKDWQANVTRRMKLTYYISSDILHIISY